MEKFIQLVADMRHYQKKYFRYRAPDDLRMAKDLERQVDTEIKQLTGTGTAKPEPEHPKLF